MFSPFANLHRVHFVGIGGAGMSGIAEVLLDYDLQVSGCDMVASETTDRLASLGASVHVGHSTDHVEDVDLVVISSAVSKDNPEVQAAKRSNITIVRRAEMLGELMRLKYGIAVAGTHGKTTTTSLVGAVLVEAGLDPTVIVRGRLRVSGTGARLGKSEYLVAEADEYDRSFLRGHPHVAVVTNVEHDHPDLYPDLLREYEIRYDGVAKLVNASTTGDGDLIATRSKEWSDLSFRLTHQSQTLFEATEKLESLEEEWKKKIAD